MKHVERKPSSDVIERRIQVMVRDPLHHFCEAWCLRDVEGIELIVPETLDAGAFQNPHIQNEEYWEEYG